MIIFFYLNACTVDDAVDVLSGANDIYYDQQLQDQVQLLTDERDSLSRAVVSLDGQRTVLNEQIQELQRQKGMIENSTNYSCPCH